MDDGYYRRLRVLRNVLTCMTSMRLLSGLLAFLALQSANVLIHRVGASVSAFSTRKSIAPKVMLIGMYDDEGNLWHNIPEFNLLEHNISLPLLSPLYPQVFCTSDSSICQLVTSEGEANAAVSITALLLSGMFDLTQTYLFIAGVAGISPKMGTLASITFPRYAAQVGLQYEIDAREIPNSFTSGYFPQGTTGQGMWPEYNYGTEVFELNDALRQIVVSIAKNATLFDDDSSRAYRAHYATSSAYAAGAAPPSVVACDTATSDQWISGDLLMTMAENTTKLFTNGTGVYCTTQQEDNASLEALLRGAVYGLVDFARIIIMRAASDFDRPYPGQTAYDNLVNGQEAGYDASLQNLRIAGVLIVTTIVNEWETKFKMGVKLKNYIGDAFGSLGGKPDFGPGSITGGKPEQIPPSSKRRRSRKMSPVL